MTEQFTYGGLETQIENQTSCLTSFDINFFLATGKYEKDSVEKLGLNGFIGNLNFNYSKPIDFLEQVYILSNFIKKNKIDLVHAHPYLSLLPAICSAYQSDVPVVMTNHSIYLFDVLYGETFNYLLSSLVFPVVNKVFCVSKEVKDVTEKYCDPLKVIVIPNAVNQDKFMPVRLEKNHRWALISRLDQQKCAGIKDFLIKADDSMIKEIDIYGDGPELESLINFVEKELIKIKVNFLGASTKIENDLKKGYTGVIGMGRVAMEAIVTKMPLILLGSDGNLKGLLKVDMLERAAWSNFSGRGLETINRDQLLIDLDNLESHISLLDTIYRWYQKNYNDKIFWKIYLNEIMDLTPQKTEEASIIIDRIKSIWYSKTPLLFHGELRVVSNRGGKSEIKSNKSTLSKTTINLIKNFLSRNYWLAKLFLRLKSILLLPNYSLRNFF